MNAAASRTSSAARAGARDSSWTSGSAPAGASTVMADRSYGRPGRSRPVLRRPRTRLRRLPELLRPVLDRPPQPLAQLHLGLPAEQVARACDVRLADLGVVDRERLEDDLRTRL